MLAEHPSLGPRSTPSPAGSSDLIDVVSLHNVGVRDIPEVVSLHALQEVQLELHLPPRQYHDLNSDIRSEPPCLPNLQQRKRWRPCARWLWTVENLTAQSIHCFSCSRGTTIGKGNSPDLCKGPNTQAFAELQLPHVNWSTEHHRVLTPRG